MCKQQSLCQNFIVELEEPKFHELTQFILQTQKEQYLNYLRVFRGDNRNIFERQKKTTVRVPHPRHIDHYGQSPFPGMTDAAAVAMAAALTRSQQPQTHTGEIKSQTHLDLFYLTF